MTRSYEKINYGVRPAKNIERKMLRDAFRRLSEFGSIESYRYVGFGSTYFSDFYLLHKSLGITNMVSIEHDVANEARFRFNLPFSCIDMKFEESTDVLTTMPWDVRTILWLDYDDPLDASMLTDVSLFCANAITGSALVVTVNAQPDWSEDSPLETLRQAVGPAKVPYDVTEANLTGWGAASTYRRIITNEIAESLNERNGIRAAGSKILYKQLFHFRYADGAKMLTVGGLLFDEGQKGNVAKCGFDDLTFVKAGDEPYSIRVPNLTYRELRHLDAQLPVANPLTLASPGVPSNDLENYALLYKHFPMFADVDM